MIGALACSVVLAGCTSTVRGSATAADGPSEARSAVRTPPDVAHLEAALPQLSDVADLPGGWSDGFGVATDDWTRPALTDCLGGRTTTADRLLMRGGKVLGDQYDHRVQSMVVSYRSQQVVDDDNAMLTSVAAAACFTQIFEEQTRAAHPGEAELGPVTLTVAPDDDSGPSNVVATVSGSFTVTRPTGEVFPAYFDLVFLTGRMTEAQLILQSPGAPFPPDARERLTAAMVQRLAAL